MPTLRAKFGGRSPLKVISDLKENEGREIEAELLASEVDDADEAPHLEGAVTDIDEAIPEGGDVALNGEAANFGGDGTAPPQGRAVHGPLHGPDGYRSEEEGPLP